MDEREQKRQEILQELARRFRDSASSLKHVARRIDQASKTHEEMRQRMNRAGERLQECVNDEASRVPFTYLEYVEFTSAEEFHKFRAMDVISEEEIQAVDFEQLCTQLLSA